MGEREDPVVFKKQAKPEPEARKPTLIARCKQSPDSDFWVTIGAAWPADLGGGKAGFSVNPKGPAACVR